MCIVSKYKIRFSEYANKYVHLHVQVHINSLTYSTDTKLILIRHDATHGSDVCALATRTRLPIHVCNSECNASRLL